MIIKMNMILMNDHHDILMNLTLMILMNLILVILMNLFLMIMMMILPDHAGLASALNSCSVRPLAEYISLPAYDDDNNF